MRRQIKTQEGSVLVLTLLMVSLLVLLSLAFAATVRMELRKVVNQQQQDQVLNQARLALSLAIGRLQETAGADKRVTALSGLAGFTEVGDQSHWTGVWPTDSTAGPSWLVSGPGSVNPSMSLDSTNSVVLVRADPSDPTEVALRAPLQTLSSSSGRIAWWVGDEGVKARVDILRAAESTPGVQERKVRAQSPREPDLISLGGAWAEEPNATLFARNASSARSRLASRNTVGLAAAKVPDQTLFHDVTVHGYGLPVNVKQGGLKADWSVILDRSRDGSALVEHYMGARPAALNPTQFGAGVWSFPENQIYNPQRFFLSERIGTQVTPASRRPGPNLGILWHYGRLWREVVNHQIPLVGNSPRVESDMRRENWLPYNSANRSKGNESDQQHTNSAITPILSHLQIGLRLRSTLQVPVTPGLEQYKLQVEFKPVIGMWNPYSIGISGDTYLIDWFPTPMVRLHITPPTGPAYTTTTWFRVLNWSGTSGPERWMQLYTPSGTDFQPGEVRMFSLRQLETRDNPGSITLSPTWSSGGAILFDLKTGTHPDALQSIIVPEGSRIVVQDVYLQDTHDTETQANAATFKIGADTAMSWLTFKARGSGGIYMTRYTGMWNGGPANQAAPTTVAAIPARVLAGSSKRINALVENMVGGDFHMATWAFHLRTSTQMEIPNQRLRGWVDADPRAIVGASRWDGTRDPTRSSFEGWNFLAALMGGIPYDDVLPPSATDGHPHLNRGLVAVGFGAHQAPQMDDSDPNRFRGYMGASNTRIGGYTHLPLFDVPTAPLVSVGQFQHAQLGRYTFEPGFVAGNSYANLRIPLNQTVATNFNGLSGFNLHDISYDVNQRIWDQMYFSTLAPDYVGGGSSWDSAFANRLQRLPNPRMVYVPNRGDSSLDALMASADSGRRGAEALSSRIRILGAFNINSTSKTAWKAVLSSMVTAELPVVNPVTRALSWENPEGIRFNRFGHVLSSQPYQFGEGDHEGFWRGWRQLSALELDQLAEAIVEEVKARGPFRSMGDFVNRNPAAASIQHRRKGALQAALDRTVNAQGTALPDDLGRKAQTPSGSHFSDAVDGESEAAGFPGFVLQGDILQSLAPILQARSDTFVIRAYGDIGNAATPGARAWCEAVVQRVSDYVDPSNSPWHNPVDDVLHPLNQRFGRRFEIVSFRWLEAEEVEAL